jgi:hypothetical protein
MAMPSLTRHAVPEESRPHVQQAEDFRTAAQEQSHPALRLENLPLAESPSRPPRERAAC